MVELCEGSQNDPVVSIDWCVLTLWRHVQGRVSEVGAATSPFAGPHHGQKRAEDDHRGCAAKPHHVAGEHDIPPRVGVVVEAVQNEAVERIADTALGSLQQPQFEVLLLEFDTVQVARNHAIGR
jgi:hypothetical protein